MKVAQARAARRASMGPMMVPAVYVGHHGRSGALLALTEHGAVKARSFRKLPEKDRFLASEMVKLKGLPWCLNGKYDVAKASVPLVGSEIARGIPILPDPVKGTPSIPPKGKRMKQIYITGADVGKYHGTDGCDACTEVYVSGRASGTHTSACRARMIKLMEEDDEGGRARLEQRKRRMVQSSHADQERHTSQGQAEGQEATAASASGEPTMEVEAQATTDPVPETILVPSTGEGKRKGGEEEEARAKAARKEEKRGEKRQVEEDPAPRAGSTARLDIDQDIVVGPEKGEDHSEEHLMVSSMEAVAASLAAEENCVTDLSCVEQMVVQRYRADELDISLDEAKTIAKYLVEVSGVDVAEIYSPKRFTSQCLKLGLRGGFAIDLTVQKKNGEFWDLNKASDEEELEKLQEEEDPEALIGSPPCTVYSILRRLSDHKRDPDVVRKEREEGRHHIGVSVRAYARQMRKGKVFLHEAPKEAGSWEEPDMVWLAAQPGVIRVNGPMCRWDMTQEDAAGVGFIRKETGWLTNSQVLADLLQGVCVNLKKDRKEWHRHIMLVGGRAQYAQVYPPKLVIAILKTIKSQILRKGAISSVELAAAGPTAEQAEVWSTQEYEGYWDDVNGGMLDAGLARAARKLELDWVCQEKVYSYRQRSEAVEKGMVPIPLLWIDTNKGDNLNPMVRSRLVVRERNKGKNAIQSPLEPEQLFSAMPPLEALKLQLSLKCSVKVSKRKKTLLFAHFDISRAHFMPKAEREIYVELPDEDPKKAEGFIGILERTMYGTQDASNLWQKDCTNLLGTEGHQPGKANPSIFYSPKWDAWTLVHGDDFFALGDKHAIDNMHEL